MTKYSVTEEQKKRFAGIYLLEYIINTPHAFSVFLDDNDQDLEPVLEWLMMKGYIQILEGEKYIPTPEGRKELLSFMQRYSEFLTLFDIFSAVDLETGEFAFARYFEFDENADWKKFLNDDRWEDLRVAVANFKGMDAVEIVFMSFISEKRFGRDKSGWQFDLLLGSVWDDILDVCNSALQWQQLGYEDEDGQVKAEDVIVQIVEEGTDIMLGLLDEEERRGEYDAFSDSDGEADDEYFVDRVDMPRCGVDDLQNYRDPYYRGSAWRN